jgi:uncharacterized repeat protein (TIGR01451 family)
MDFDNLPLAILSAPAITMQPADQTITAPNMATFIIGATSSMSVAYQWQSNSGSGWTNITAGTTDENHTGGPTSASYTTLATAIENNGTQFRCVVTNDLGSTTSNTATLTVVRPPNLGISESASPSGSVSAGDVIQYTIQYNNTGDLPSVDAVISNAIPLNTYYVSGSASASDPDAIIEYVTNWAQPWLGAELLNTTVINIIWHIYTVDPGESGTVTFSVKVFGESGSLSGQTGGQQDVNTLLSFVDPASTGTYAIVLCLIVLAVGTTYYITSKRSKLGVGWKRR